MSSEQLKSDAFLNQLRSKEKILVNTTDENEKKELEHVINMLKSRINDESYKKEKEINIRNKKIEELESKREKIKNHYERADLRREIRSIEKEIYDMKHR